MTRMTHRIMVVDDDENLRYTLELILKDKGWNVITAEDGFEAIRMASEGQIDLIFVDLKMPGMDGVEAFLKIKEILPNCIVVIMTGHAVDSLIEKALSEGVRTCLIKPVTIEKLFEIVDEVLPAQVI